MAVRIAARSASCEPSIQAPWVMLAALWAGGRLSTRDSWAERGVSATEISIEQALLGLAPTHDAIQHSGERIE